MTDEQLAFGAPPSLTSLCDALRNSPRHTPQFLAIEAVRRLGPAASDRIGWLSDRYPGVSAGQLAAMTVQRHLGMSRNVGLLAGLAGPVGALAGLGAAWWFTARMVLELAAGYGFDPADRHRAAELLLLTGVQDDLETADIAVRTAQTILEAVESSPSLQSVDVEPRPHSTGLGWLIGTGMTRAGVARVARSWMPGSPMVLGALAGDQGTRRLADRASLLYRQRLTVMT